MRKVMASMLSLLIMLLPAGLIAGSKTTVKTWNPKVKKGSVKAQRMTTADGKKVLVAQDGKMYLLDRSGKRYMVDQSGNKIQVNQAGKLIQVGDQRNVIKRMGPGPLC